MQIRKIAPASHSKRRSHLDLVATSVSIDNVPVDGETFMDAHEDLDQYFDSLEFQAMADSSATSSTMADMAKCAGNFAKGLAAATFVAMMNGANATITDGTTIDDTSVLGSETSTPTYSTGYLNPDSTTDYTSDYVSQDGNSTSLSPDSNLSANSTLLAANATASANETTYDFTRCDTSRFDLELSSKTDFPSTFTGNWMYQCENNGTKVYDNWFVKAGAWGLPLSLIIPSLFWIVGFADHANIRSKGRKALQYVYDRYLTDEEKERIQKQDEKKIIKDSWDWLVDKVTKAKEEGQKAENSTQSDDASFEEIRDLFEEKVEKSARDIMIDLLNDINETFNTDLDTFPRELYEEQTNEVATVEEPKSFIEKLTSIVTWPYKAWTQRDKDLFITRMTAALNGASHLYAVDLRYMIIHSSVGLFNEASPMNWCNTACITGVLTACTQGFFGSNIDARVARSNSLWGQYCTLVTQILSLMVGIFVHPMLGMTMVCLTFGLADWFMGRHQSIDYLMAGYIKDKAHEDVYVGTMGIGEGWSGIALLLFNTILGSLIDQKDNTLIETHVLKFVLQNTALMLLWKATSKADQAWRGTEVGEKAYMLQYQDYQRNLTIQKDEDEKNAELYKDESAMAGLWRKFRANLKFFTERCKAGGRLAPYTLVMGVGWGFFCLLYTAVLPDMLQVPKDFPHNTVINAFSVANLLPRMFTPYLVDRLLRTIDYRQIMKDHKIQWSGYANMVPTFPVNGAFFTKLCAMLFLKDYSRHTPIVEQFMSQLDGIKNDYDTSSEVPEKLENDSPESRRMFLHGRKMLDAIVETFREVEEAGEAGGDCFADLLIEKLKTSELEQGKGLDREQVVALSNEIETFLKLPTDEPVTLEGFKEQLQSLMEKYKFDNTLIWSPVLYILQLLNLTCVGSGVLHLYANPSAVNILAVASQAFTLGAVNSLCFSTSLNSTRHIFRDPVEMATIPLIIVGCIFIAYVMGLTITPVAIPVIGKIFER